MLKNSYFNNKFKIKLNKFLKKIKIKNNLWILFKIKINIFGNYLKFKTNLFFKIIIHFFI